MVPKCLFCKKDILKTFEKFSRKHLCQSLFFNKVAALRSTALSNKKETLVQVFSCEFCEIFKNTSFHKTAPVAASVRKIYEIEIC